MKTISTTNARKHFKDLIDFVSETGGVVGIGRRDDIAAIMLKFPRDYNQNLNDISNINSYSESFSFLEHEPDIYTVNDLKKRYA
jgi:hypothetical protein